MTAKMTKKEFKRAMQCGLGRCIQELCSGADIEKYRDIVLWGLTRNLAYDAQCEGTRSDYLYELVACYPDETPFVEAVISCLEKSASKSGWDFLQFCRFLELSAREGNRTAADALQNEYLHMYGILKQHGRRTRRNRAASHLDKEGHISKNLIPVLENFENLCISIINLPKTQKECEIAYLNIVEDAGALLIDTSWLHAWDFAWFQDCAEDAFGKAKISKLLTQSAKSSQNVRAYLDFWVTKEIANGAHTERYKKAETITATEIYESLRRNTISDAKKEFPLLWTAIMQRKWNSAEVEKLSDYYRTESDISVRSRLLRLLANRYCAELLDAETVIQDSRSCNPALREHAFRALEYMKGDVVHTYALELSQKSDYIENAICMLANNYRKEDSDLLVSMVKSLPVTYRETIPWHGAFSAVLDMFKSGAPKHPPKELLPYLYEHTLCSCCREYVLREMSRRRMVSRQLLEECLYDCNSEIRKFAKGRLKR